MTGIIAAIEAQPPERLAVVAGAHRLSFARLNADIAAAAALFADNGIDPSTSVGIRVGPLAIGQSYASWVAHLAAIRLGCRHVTMVEKASIADTLKSDLIDMAIGSPETLKAVPRTLRALAFDCDPATPLPPPAVAPPNREEQARRLNLTSGTTGTPKFIEWDAAMLRRRVEQVADGLALTDATVHYNLLHLRTTAGFRYPIAVWMAGGSVLLPEDDLASQRDRQALGQSTLLACSPPQLDLRLDGLPGRWEGRDDRTIVLLGGRLPPVLYEQALDRACAAMLVSYGSTETGSVAIGDAATIARHPGAVGFVRDGVEVAVVDDGGAAVAAGTPGQVRIRSPMMVDGYADGGDNAAMRDGWFHPGDIGILFDDGLLAIDGRATDTFNIGGWKVNVHDLEAKLGFLPGVIDRCACVMRLDDGDLLTFAIACNDDCDLDRTARLIKAKLPRGLRFHVVRVRGIPRNAMGKIPRALIAQQLTALYGARKANLSHA